MKIVQYHIALYQAPDHLAACDQAEGTIMAITPRLGQDQTQAPAVREKEDDGNLPRGEDSALRKGSDHASSSDSFPSFALEPSGSAEGGGTGGEVPGRCDLHLRASAAVRRCETLCSTFTPWPGPSSSAVRHQMPSQDDI